jgi:exopolysaccharide biosynthesis WecB/TagA/CpsF family protein
VSQIQAHRRPHAGRTTSTEPGPAPGRTASRVILVGTAVDLMDAPEALRIIEGHWHLENARPLAVCSVNLDHIHHFGTRGRWHGTGSHHAAPGTRPIEWLNLVDGAPVATRLERATGTGWPRLAGSDLIGPILERAQTAGLRVGFLGGTPETHRRLRQRLRLERPALSIAGLWSPSPDQLADPAYSRALAAQIAAARTDILVVCLGKPRQEVWIAEYGALTGARTLLAFGAVVDFLAGRVDRAPRWIADHGLEWAWRLGLEPKRLAKRYLVQGPGAYLAVRRSEIRPIPLAAKPTIAAVAPMHSGLRPLSNPGGRFATVEHPEVTAITVTYNSARHIRTFIDSLRGDARTTRLRLIVADNGSTDETLRLLAQEDDVTVISTGANLGYAGGINAALPAVSAGSAVLILNPDLTVAPGAVRALLDRMGNSGAGIVVPAIREGDGHLSHSLRREPTVARTLGDALFGERLPRRGGTFSEIDRDAMSYRFPHRIDWATGAALLIRGDVSKRLGDWDERYFLYSEETEYFRRVRDAGETVWFEPGATVMHAQGGSGIRPEFTALMAVNRVRYAEATAGPIGAAGVRVATILHAGLRAYQPAQRSALGILLRRASWSHLPRAQRRTAIVTDARGVA